MGYGMHVGGGCTHTLDCLLQHRQGPARWDCKSARPHRGRRLLGTGLDQRHTTNHIEQYSFPIQVLVTLGCAKQTCKVWIEVVAHDPDEASERQDQ